MCALVTLPSSLMSRFSWISISVSLSILSTCGLGAIAAERGVRECGGGGQERSVSAACATPTHGA